jgi:two-component system, OmpR family, response regulator
MGKTILVVDDDAHIREVVEFALVNAGFEVAQASDGQQALSSFRHSIPDLVILDITMPEIDGLAVCREIRKTSDLPILFLSSRSDEIDRVVGLEIGGDDYVTKPFSPRELVARVQIILKRTQQKPATLTDKKLSRGLLMLDIEGHTCFCKDRRVPLTATEFAILKTLLGRPERVYTRDELMDEAYRDNLTVSDRTIDSHIRHIRRKYVKAGCESVIETVHGIGYKLGPCD